MNRPLRTLGLASVLSIVCIFSQVSAGEAATSISTSLKALDTDHDGTLDINEVKAAGAAVFDRLDRDHDGTLDARELKGHLSAKEFSAADTDHDGTVSKDEYLALVARRFEAATPTNDGTLGAKQLKSRSGRALLRLLK